MSMCSMSLCALTCAPFRFVEFKKMPVSFSVVRTHIHVLGIRACVSQLAREIYMCLQLCLQWDISHCFMFDIRMPKAL